MLQMRKNQQKAYKNSTANRYQQQGKEVRMRKISIFFISPKKPGLSFSSSQCTETALKRELTKANDSELIFCCLLRYRRQMIL